MSALLAPTVLAPDAAALRARIDARLAHWVPEPPQGAEAVCAAMHGCLLAPGKRVRPLLLLLAAGDLGVEPAAVLDAACAVEMVHAASLVLDDLPCMDDATLRRGQPCTHVAHGEDVAILAAIGLLGQAFRAVSGGPLPAAVRAQCATLLAEAVGPTGLVGGQCRDLHAVAGGAPEAAQQTNHLKTGALFHAALAMAALAARADARTQHALATFAQELGQAFQLADDIADACASSAQTGKDVRLDAGKPTLVALLGVPAARERLAGHRARGHAVLADALGPDAGLLRYAAQLV